MAPKVDYDGELYKAVVEGKKEKVTELCKKFPEGPLRIITIHDDTVLHMASQTDQDDLVLLLLRELPQTQLCKMTHGNEVGNTILHEAATSNNFVTAAREMLLRAPELLPILNNYGETALFRAARYGNTAMFNFLDQEFKKKYSEQDLKTFHRKKDKSATILHASIIGAQFGVALEIAKRYEYLVSEKDSDGMTGLQHLSRDKTTFRKRSGRNLMRFINSCISSKDATVGEEDSPGWRFPWLEASRMEVQRYDSALKLAKFLIEKDTSWKDTEQFVEDSENGEKSGKSKKRGTESKAQTPLFLATRHGCVEIAKEILVRYPQAVEHVDNNGRTILHIAIKHRQLEILDDLEVKDILMKKLIRKCDKYSNSILHMVGLKDKNSILDDTQSPAVQLQKEWELFERVQKVCSHYFFRNINKKKRTAEEIFAKNNQPLHQKAKEWLQGTAQNSSIVAVLIATVAFAAAYTVPGGSNSETGVPILINEPLFVVFTITEVLSLSFALTSVILFLSILTSPFRLIDFKRSLPRKLTLGFTTLIFSVSMMMLAFSATIILMIRNKQQWTKVALYSASFLPVLVFAFSILPLYSSLLINSKVLKIIVSFFSSFFKSRESTNPVQTEATSSLAPQTTRSLV